MSFTLHKSQKYLEFSAVLPDVVTNWGPQPNSHQALHDFLADVQAEFERIVLECFDLGGPICQLGQCTHHKSEVLNDRFPLKFHQRRNLIEGVILATGFEPIPKEYVQGMAVPFPLTVWDQFRNEISVESKLSVDRSMIPRPRMVRPQSSLNDSREIPDTHEPLGSKDPGIPAAPVATPIAKTQDHRGK
jgi:hypothetical protein